MKEANAQKPRLGFEKGKPFLVFAGALVLLAPPVHVPAPANVPLGRKFVAVLVLELHGLAPGHGGEADGLIQEIAVGGNDEVLGALQEGG